MKVGKEREGGTETSKDDPSNAVTDDEEAYAEELARKVRFLFDTCRKETGERYTFLEVQEATKGKIHQSWISKMANGQVLRPGIKSLKALSDFFQIDPSFWFNPLDDAVKVKHKVENGPQQLQTVMLRASELEVPDLDFLIETIDLLKRRNLSGKGQKSKAK